MKRVIFIILLLPVCSLGYSQGYENLIFQIEKNNHKIISLEKWLKAEAAGARTGLLPQNPEISYNYLFGNGEIAGDQQEFEVIQTFRIPKYYKTKSAIQQENYYVKELSVVKERKEILFRATEVFFEMIWLSQREIMLQNKYDDAEEMVVRLEDALEAGEIAKTELVKSRINALKIQGELDAIRDDYQIAEKRLIQLNGGKQPENLELVYPKGLVLPKVDSLILQLNETNVDLSIGLSEINQLEQQINLQKLDNWPTFEAGYKSERIFDQRLRGIHTGISIPIWKNSNKVKYKVLQQEWKSAAYDQVKSDLYEEIKILYVQAKSYEKRYNKLAELVKEDLVSQNAKELLKAGKITYSQYLFDIEIMYEMKDDYMESQRNYYNTLAAIEKLVD